MDYNQLGKEILKAVGGKSNVISIVHCMTRVRFTLKDQTIVNDEAVKGISGVLGVAKSGGQYQVIIGNHVDKVYDVIVNEGRLSEPDELAHEKKKLNLSNIISSFFNMLSSILAPLIPALAASGMVKVILILLLQFNILQKTDSTYIILSFMSDATYYFMPIFVAYCASNYFKCNNILAMVFASMLIHPKFIGLIGSEEAITLFGLPVTAVKYASSIIPSIAMVWVMSYVEKFADKVSPAPIKVFFKPLLMMLIVAPITLIIIGPSGDFLGQKVADLATLSYTRFGWITVGILGATLPFIVMTGLNRAISPVSMQIFTSLGFEPLFRVAYIGSNLAQGGACLAVAIRTKNKELRQIAVSAATTSLLSGITEPSLFGVTIPLKRPLIACSIAGGVAGIYAGLMGVKAYAYATPGLLAMPMFIGPDAMNIVHACIAAVIGIFGTFILTLIFGFDDPVKKEVESQLEKQLNIHTQNEIVELKAPSKGKLIPLQEVNDDAFASGACGVGIAIIPDDDYICAPISGKLGAIFETAHAFVIESEQGIEVLVHIGVDTVLLNGKHFEVLVDKDIYIQEGTPIIKINREALEKLNYDLTTCILIQNNTAMIDYFDANYGEVDKMDMIQTLILEKKDR